MKLSKEGIDVGMVVDNLRAPDEGFTPALKDSIYSIGGVAVTFNLEKGSVIMRLVEKADACHHERLDEDGYCRRCGEDCRGSIGSIRA